METLSHNSFLDKYLRTSYKEPWFPSAECVWLAKLYVKEVYWITLWSFGGTARSGWFNKKKTFDPKKWEKIEWRPWLVPKRGDIIFYDKTKENLNWHVSICHEANKIDITVVEQNGFTWNWAGKSYDQVNLETKRDYRGILGWYRKK